MGATNTVLYQEYLSKNDLIQIYGDNFNEDLFNELKNDEEMIEVRKLQEIIKERNNNEKLLKLNEIQKQFKLYCNNNNNKMNSRVFIQYLRDAKLLSKKNNFQINDAEIIYDKIKSIQSIQSNNLDYLAFVSGFTILSERIGIDRDLLITKLSKVEYKPENKTKGLRNSSTHSSTSTNNDENSNQSQSNEVINSNEKTAAAIKLQTLSRERAAKKQVTDLREV